MKRILLAGLTLVGLVVVLGAQSAVARQPIHAADTYNCSTGHTVKDLTTHWWVRTDDTVSPYFPVAAHTLGQGYELCHDVTVGSTYYDKWFFYDTTVGYFWNAFPSTGTDSSTVETQATAEGPHEAISLSCVPGHTGEWYIYWNDVYGGYYVAIQSFGSPYYELGWINGGGANFDTFYISGDPGGC